MNKILSVLRGSAISLGILCAVASTANAERGFPCLDGASGKSLLWDASWQSDRDDDGEQYLVSEILHFETNTSYTAVLKLMSEGGAKRETRHLPIASAVMADAVCDALTQRSPQRQAKSKSAQQRDSGSYSARNPQFIKYSREGWVRADVPRTQIPFETCVIMGREFLCLEEDKARFGEQLQLVAEQIEAQPQLRR